MWLKWLSYKEYFDVSGLWVDVIGDCVAWGVLAMYTNMGIG